MSGILVPKPMLGRQLRKGHRSARGLAGLWLFNEGSGDIVSDLSGNGNTGTFGASAPSWSAGKFGHVLTFASGDNIVIADKINPTNAVSCTGWLKSTGTAPQTILGWNVTSANISGIWFAIDLSRDAATKTRIFFYLKNVGTGFVDFAGARDDGLWHFYAATYDGSKARFYLDGIQGDSLNRTGTIGYDGTNSYIGILDGGGSPIIGDLDLPSLYNRTLTSSEIAELYREPFGMFDREPLPLWTAATQGVIAPPGIVVLRRRIEAA